MTEYSESCVYRFIYNNDNITYYVGSTKNYDKRLAEHKCSCNNINGIPYNYPLYNFMRNNGGFSAWTMDIIQYYPECQSEEELRMHERYYYDIHDPPLNTNAPFRTKEELAEYRAKYQIEYRASNADVIKANNTLYRQNNMAIIIQKRSVVVNCPCGSVINYGNSVKHTKSKKHRNFLRCVHV